MRKPRARVPHDARLDGMACGCEVGNSGVLNNFSYFGQLADDRPGEASLASLVETLFQGGLVRTEINGIVL